MSSFIPHAFLTGAPLGHSASPYIHRYWLQIYDLEGEYTLVPHTPQTIEAFLKTFPKQGFCGGNITLPFKERAFAVLEKKDAAAHAIGAVNTVWCENNQIYGGNSDAYGFSKGLEAVPGAPFFQRALVLGAGGAARAILYALKQRKTEEIVLCNRTLSHAQSLAQFFGKSVRVVPWAQRHSCVKNMDLIVNTTPLTLEGYVHTEPFLVLEDAKEAACVYDIVYKPLQTCLLQEAAARHLRCIDGLTMLLHQAALGFSHWFGLMPQVTPALRAYVVHSMECQKRKADSLQERSYREPAQRKTKNLEKAI